MVNNTVVSHWPILSGYLSETDSVGLTAEILTLDKVKALNVAKHPCVILKTVSRGSNIKSKLLMVRYLGSSCAGVSMYIITTLPLTSMGHCSLSGWRGCSTASAVRHPPGRMSAPVSRPSHQHRSTLPNTMISIWDLDFFSTKAIDTTLFTHRLKDFSVAKTEFYVLYWLHNGDWWNLLCCWDISPHTDGYWTWLGVEKLRTSVVPVTHPVGELEL